MANDPNRTPVINPDFRNIAQDFRGTMQPGTRPDFGALRSNLQGVPFFNPQFQMPQNPFSSKMGGGGGAPPFGLPQLLQQGASGQFPPAGVNNFAQQLRPGGGAFAPLSAPPTPRPPTLGQALPGTLPTPKLPNFSTLSQVPVNPMQVVSNTSVGNIPDFLGGLFRR